MLCWFLGWSHNVSEVTGMRPVELNTCVENSSDHVRFGFHLRCCGITYCKMTIRKNLQCIVEECERGTQWLCLKPHWNYHYCCLNSSKSPFTYCYGNYNKKYRKSCTVVLYTILFEVKIFLKDHSMRTTWTFPASRPPTTSMPVALKLSWLNNPILKQQEILNSLDVVFSNFNLRGFAPNIGSSWTSIF